MKAAFFIMIILNSLSPHAQYYYNDITGTEEINRRMQLYLALKVKTVTAEGYTPEGSKATDFAEVQQVMENGKALRIVTNSNFNRSASYSQFNDNIRLVSIEDSSLGVHNKTTYEYDNEGRIVTVQNSIEAPDDEINQLEVHKWFYNTDGKPLKMWRTINGTDSLEIRFIPDEKGNPGEEVSYRHAVETGHIYYYFDDGGSITDIVRYNEKIKKLVPDNMLTYDENGRVIQIITSTPGDKYGRITWVGYQIWRYIYNEKGLKTTEALFNNKQELSGRIKYTYSFGQ